MEKIKILIYSLNKYNELQALQDHIINWGIANLSENDFEIQFLIDEKFNNGNKLYHFLDEFDCSVVSNDEINSIFKNEFLSEIEKNQKLSIEKLNNIEQKRFDEIVLNKFQNWKPDIILSNFVNSPRILFKNIYPNALCLTNENSIFCRPPFPRIIAYDDINPIDSFFVRYKNEIDDIKINEKENNKIEEFKNNLRKIFNDSNPIINELLEYKKQFKKTILCPLIGDFGNIFFKKVYFNNDFDLLEYIFNTIPSDIGVFVTQHDSDGILQGETLEYFKNKYPNFIFLNSTNIKGCAANSLNYFEYVDAVINTTSKTGYLATLWDKPIISLAKDYNDLIKDLDGLENINSLWNKPLRNKNHILYWYFTRYSLSIDNISKKDYFKNYLLNKLDYYRKNDINFDFMDKINDLDYILSYILNETKKYYLENGPIIKIENDNHKIKQKLQIVLITYNRKDYLKQTLDEILCDSSPIKDFDITIINNNSTDGTSEMLEGYAGVYKNITHIKNNINIGGNANICKAFSEYLDKEYIWLICDNDTYNFEAWGEIIYAINNNYDVILTRKCKNSIADIFHEANFVPSCIYKTKNITSNVIENMYDNIHNLFPHLALIAKNIIDNKNIYIVSKNIVEIGANPGYATTYNRGREKEYIPEIRRNMFWSVGFFNSIVLIPDRKKQIEIIDKLRHFHKSLFELFKSIIVYNLIYRNNYKYNIEQIFRILSFKQKIKFMLAYAIIRFSFKDYKYWFIRYKDEWIEYLKEVDEQKYIDKLAKKNKNKRVVLYGAGMFYEILAKNYDLSKLNIVGISDKKFENTNDDYFNGIKIIKPSELKNFDFDIIVFTMKLYKNIEKSLKNNKINKKMFSIIKKSNKYIIRT